MPDVQTNEPYSNRVTLHCSPLTGPFVQASPGTLGNFNPARDLEVYVDGTRVPVQTWSFDTTNNRYLMFMENQINLQGVIQVVHHMPKPPFFENLSGWGRTWGENWGYLTSLSGLPGFAILATYSAQGDVGLPPQMLLYAIPSTAAPDSPITLLWDTLNVAEIEITGSSGSPPFDSGRITTSGSGVYIVTGGFTATTILTINGYDSHGNPIPGLYPSSTVVNIA